MKAMVKKFEREIPEAGTTKAVICAVYDIGHHEEERFGNDAKKGKKISRKWLLLYELEDKRSDGKPFRLSMKYTDSLFPQSKLFALIKNLFGGLTKDQEENGFEMESLVGVSCYVPVVHYERKDKQAGAKIGGTPTKLKNGQAPLVSTFDGVMPNWVKEEAMSAVTPPEWLKSAVDVPNSADVEDDLAF